MDVLAWIRDSAPWWCAERRPTRDKAEAIQRIRKHFAAFGYPIDDMTNEQIEVGVVALGRAAREFGMSAQETAEAMRSVLAVTGQL